MISDLVELLDRQHGFMRSQQDVDLVRHLPRYVATLGRDVRILAALDELSQEAFDDLQQINVERQALAGEAARLRDQYLALFPDDDDRGSEHDARFEGDAGSHSHRTSFRTFDRLIADCQLLWPDFRERDSDRDPLEDALSLLSNRLPDQKDKDTGSPIHPLNTHWQSAPSTCRDTQTLRATLLCLARRRCEAHAGARG